MPQALTQMVTINRWVIPERIPIKEWKVGLNLSKLNRTLRGKRGKPLKK